MSESAPRAVFDCNVFLQAILSDRGPAYGCLAAVRTGTALLFVSDTVLSEIRNLPMHRSLRRFRSLTPERVERFIADLLSKSILIGNAPAAFQYPRDPDDAHYVDLAAASRAEYLVTRDADLLDLMMADTPEAKDFRVRFAAIKIVEPQAFLVALRHDAEPS